MDDHNIPQIPRTGSDVGWYRFSARPGQGGNVVFVGHINWDRAPAVFGSLDEVKRGDAIRLVANDGTEYVYEVSANFLVDPNDPKSLKVMAPTKTDTVTLITCGGKWTTDSSNPLGGSYDRRRIVQAHPA
jgi:LPXTG-site transpeptidase (sortase) family protein